LKKKDVQDIIAGNYNKRKSTRNEIAAKLKDLHDEAGYINKLEALQRGEEPKIERKKIERNQQIKELKEKIKSLQKENVESNKFYGESDASQRRIDKLEDELERLQQRKPKETKEQVEKEISPREKELKDQITEERKKIREQEAEARKKQQAEEKEANKFYQEDLPEETKQLMKAKNRVRDQIQKLESDLKTGNFSKEPPAKIKLDKDGLELKDKFN
jgi:chromosome segregation ATPase